MCAVAVNAPQRIAQIYRIERGLTKMPAEEPMAARMKHCRAAAGATACLAHRAPVAPFLAFGDHQQSAPRHNAADKLGRRKRFAEEKPRYHQRDPNAALSMSATVDTSPSLMAL